MKSHDHVKRHRSSPKYTKKSTPPQFKIPKRQKTGENSLRKPPRVSEKFPAVFSQPKTAKI